MSAFVVTLHSLFEKSKKTVNLPTLSAELGGAAQDKLSECTAVAKKIAKLRHNIFAHRSGRLTKEEVFGLASITPNEMRLLVIKAQAICRIMHRQVDLPLPFEMIGARAAIDNILSAVQRDSHT